MRDKMSSANKNLIRALKGEELPYPPFWLMRQAGRYLPEFRDLKEKSGGFLSLCSDPQKAVEITLQPIRRFNMDGAVIFSDILLVPMALGMDLTFNANGGPCLSPDLATNSTLLEVKDDFSQRLDFVYQALRETRKILTETYPSTALIGFVGAPWTLAGYTIEGGRGTRHMIRNRAYRDPQSLDRLIDVMIEASTLHALGQIEAGAEVIQIFESWADCVPARLWDRYIFHPIQRVVSAIAKHNPECPVIVFARGLGEGIEILAQCSELSAISCDESIPLSTMLRIACSGRAVQGNLDPMSLNVGGETMRIAIEELLKAFSGLPYIFNLGHGVMPSTLPENVTHLAKCIRKDV